MNKSKPTARTQSVGGDACLTARIPTNELTESPEPTWPLRELLEINRELLEALEALLDVSDFATNTRTGEIHLRAMAAIRKAKGQ